MIKAIANCPSKTAPRTDSVCACLQGTVLLRLVEGGYIGLHWLHIVTLDDFQEDHKVYWILLMTAQLFRDSCSSLMHASKKIRRKKTRIVVNAGTGVISLSLQFA